ncbi:MAG: carbamoyltransferase HypF [Desulfuromonadales bacterium]|nr:carbamoyltransferase HypF [Desulfuromonadales bacterium]
MDKKRLEIDIEGLVQGVGFRPFVAQLASRLGLTGTVGNDGRGVVIAVQGNVENLDLFLTALRAESPPLARIERLQLTSLPTQPEEFFVILASSGDGDKVAAITPDAHLCDDCLAELLDPDDRRYHYPFINCTNCGPRFSIITGIPYDRPQTTMAEFPLCPACAAEYRNPASRRYHAQPIACPACGPQLSLLSFAGIPLEGDPLAEAIALLQAGKIVAIKGLGGYHLAVDAENDGAVARLRQRKRRDEKPLALMVPSLAGAHALAQISPAEGRLLTSVERPIVLLSAKAHPTLSPGIAPRNRYLGIMLPYTPLHHLLLTLGSFSALVMTSGNHSDAPIAADDAQALDELGSIADAFLLHNRRIHTRIDDSIARVLADKPLLLRRARGYVPRAVVLPISSPPILALGGELKNTLCLTRNDRAYLSQHLGDLSNLESCAGHVTMGAHLQHLLELHPTVVAHDLHPDYQTTRLAESLSGIQRIAVQHHHAHLASCLAENGQSGPALGVIFDGLGYGADGTIWGGEFLLGDLDDFRRVAYFAPTAMPGGDLATREPWRMALAYLQQAYDRDYPRLPFLQEIARRDEQLVVTMIEKGINAPLSSSCGRLFDAVAALIGLRNRVSYEGQAAIELEMVAEMGDYPPYPITLDRVADAIVFAPQVMIRAIVDDLIAGIPMGEISARFHATLVDVVVRVCARVRVVSGINTIALSGGVFQNCLLTETVIVKLEQSDFSVLTHSLVPPNDGGLSLGQAAVAAARLQNPG